MQLGLVEISLLVGIVLSTLTAVGVFIKIGVGQGIAKTREENFVGEITTLKKKDGEFESDIKEIKTDIFEIKVLQEQRHGELKLGISNLENNILREFRKLNGKGA